MTDVCSLSDLTSEMSQLLLNQFALLFLHSPGQINFTNQHIREQFNNLSEMYDSCSTCIAQLDNNNKTEILQQILRFCNITEVNKLMFSVPKPNYNCFIYCTIMVWHPYKYSVHSFHVFILYTILCILHVYTATTCSVLFVGIIAACAQKCHAPLHSICYFFKQLSG